MSKAKFDRVFWQYDTQQWKSLQFSDDDDDDIHEQIDYFTDNYFLIELFPQLQSFSMLKIKTGYRYNTLLYQLQSLTNLNSLIIESICRTTMPKFYLSKLQRLILSSCRNTKWIKVILEKYKPKNSIH
jgi:tRNA uridine 5-carbamoylmethylation protein Kti12